MEYIIPGKLLQVCKQQKLWKLTLQFHFLEAKIIYKKLTRKMEIVILGSNLPINLDYFSPAEGSK